MDGIKDIDHNEIEKRKDRVRRTWEYKNGDHIPIGFFIDDFSDHSLKELCEKGTTARKGLIGSITGGFLNQLVMLHPWNMK